MRRVCFPIALAAILLALLGCSPRGQEEALTATTTSYGGPVSTSTPASTAVPVSQAAALTVGLDVEQPLPDPDAPARPGMKVLTTWVAVGNRLDAPLPFVLSDLVLEDIYGQVYTTTVPPVREPALDTDVIPAREVVGGYVSWEVPFHVWPFGVTFYPQGRTGLGRSWQTPVFTDVNAGHRYYWDIGALKYRGAVEGYPDGSFRPEETVLGAEFARLIVRRNLSSRMRRSAYAN